MWHILTNLDTGYEGGGDDDDDDSDDGERDGDPAIPPPHDSGDQITDCGTDNRTRSQELSDQPVYPTATRPGTPLYDVGMGPGDGQTEENHQRPKILFGLGIRILELAKGIRDGNHTSVSRVPSMVYRSIHPLHFHGNHDYIDTGHGG